MSVLRTGRGRAGGGGEVEYLTEQFFSLRNVPGVFGAPHAPTRGSRGVGKQYTSSYDHDM